MENYTGTISPPGMYVKALYDYEADDRTSLSFRQGDVIRVLTQLESGWWDGVIHGIRGWFPSNYCVLVNEADAKRLDNGETYPLDVADPDLESESSMDEHDYDAEIQGYAKGPASAHHHQHNLSDSNGNGNSILGSEQEEAAFWIPQATADGRLYYFNTLTGVSTMELPLESPVSLTETGPRDRSRIYSSADSRPPPELMAAGLETEDDTDYGSASEVDEMSKSATLLPGAKKRRSYLSDGASPSASTESLTNLPVITRTQTEQQISKTSFSGTLPGGDVQTPALPQRHFGDVNAIPLTWNRLSDDMRKSVDRYRQAINNSDRSDFVRRAEDMSDHLRLLLAAASGTTDNHSGNPSIISTNKALYPHFRDMMSRFSKLVLSSHIASADWPAGDSYGKCLQEADGVLNAVYNFIEVARQQRGEELPRIVPGFVSGQATGANWQMNGLSSHDLTNEIALVDQDDYEPFGEPSLPLEHEVLDEMSQQKVVISATLRELDHRLVLSEKIISHEKHSRMSEGICTACGKVIEQYKPWMATMESLDLSPLRNQIQSAEVLEFSHQKQKVYNLVSELVIACQGVAAPLADEWQEDRGDSLEERMLYVRSLTKDLESATNHVTHRLHQFLDLAPLTTVTSASTTSVASTAAQSSKKTSLTSEASTPPSTAPSIAQDASSRSTPHKTSMSVSSGLSGRSLFDDLGHIVQSPGAASGDRSAKLKQFFGEVPVIPTQRDQPINDTPTFLRLEYEGEVQYDRKTNPPTIKGGTLFGLVEQLTRHDRYDSSFNNTFLLTYKSFTTAAKLFELLVKRWSIQPPSGLTADELATWTEKKQSLIRFRIVNVLKSWLESFWMEDNDAASKELIQNIFSFARDTISESGTPGARPLILVIEQRMRGEDAQVKRMVPTPNQETPAPILPKNLRKLKFLDIDATEFARQLTIIESRLYGKVKPRECLDKIWATKQTTDVEPAANVRSLILHSNRLTNWVAEMILTQQDVKKRVSVIKHFVSIADKCLGMANFSTLTSIISALGTAPILRLARTWSQVNSRTQATLEKLRRLMANTKNFTEYRETLHSSNPPCIPFFGVYLTDLTFIEDGIPGKIKKTDLINFAKRTKTAEVIREIQNYQTALYPFKPVSELQEYILSMMQSASDVHEMYDRSLQVEPREREDEKIARLLSESGFL